MNTNQLEPTINTKPSIDDNHVLDAVDRKKMVKVKLFFASIALLSLSGLALFATYKALPQSQNIGSRAAAGPAKTWFSFVPSTIAPSASATAKPKAIVRKKGNNKISAVKIELAYDASKITNLSVQINDWARGKPPVILEPFATSVSGTQGKATITLAAPCDALQCYPLRKLQNTLFTLNFAAIGTSTIQATTNSFVTLTGLGTNTYDQSFSQSLTVNAVNQ